MEIETKVLGFQEVLARAKRGAGWLDETCPRWRMRVKPDSLKMKSCVGCVIGQVTGDFHNIWFNITGVSLTKEFVGDMGFAFTDEAENSLENWDTLQEA